MSVGSAIARIQQIAQACTSVTFKSAPTAPVVNVEPFPCSICYIVSGTFHFTNATMHHNFPSLALELHFSPTNLQQAYMDIGEIAIEFPRRLAGDPTLDGAVETILATRDNPISYEVRPFQWTQAVSDKAPVVMSQMLAFTIPVKLLRSPL